MPAATACVPAAASPLLLLRQAKRSRGAPKASKPGDKVTVSIVVTDVKDFSDLTRQYPEAMNKAMGVHNNILRKASHNHAGYIMDQEVCGSPRLRLRLCYRQWSWFRCGWRLHLRGWKLQELTAAAAGWVHAEVRRLPALAWRP